MEPLFAKISPEQLKKAGEMTRLMPTALRG